MKEQSFDNHKQFVIGYHFIAFSILLVILILSGYFVYNSYKESSQISTAIILLFISIYLFFSFFYSRVFALKAQDRAIRAEESLRHFILTGKEIDKRLEMIQIIALRFASDEEFPKLCQDTVNGNLSAEQIKRKIQHWRKDDYRV